MVLVEDDDMLRRMLARTLRCERFGVVEAENGEFARIFRSLYPAVPVLFMSGAMPRASHGIPLLEVGTHLLLKPFGPEVLLEAITIMLNVERSAVSSEATAAPAFPR